MKTDSDKILAKAIEIICDEIHDSQINEIPFDMTRDECVHYLRIISMHEHWLHPTMGKSDIDDYLSRIVNVAHAMAGKPKWRVIDHPYI